MFTSDEIRGFRFTSVVRGTYRIEDVDSFKEEIANQFDSLLAQNEDLRNKMTTLATRIEAYRADEENIKATLLTAQRTADTLLKESKDKSDFMLKEAEEALAVAQAEANIKAEALIGEAKFQAEEIIAKAAARSDSMLADAKREAEEQLASIQQEIQNETVTLDILKKEATAFEDDILEKYRLHVEFIQNVSAAVRDTSSPVKDSNPEEIVATDTEDKFPSDDDFELPEAALDAEENDYVENHSEEVMEELTFSIENQEDIFSAGEVFADEKDEEGETDDDAEVPAEEEKLTLDSYFQSQSSFSSDFVVNDDEGSDSESDFEAGVDVKESDDDSESASEEEVDDGFEVFLDNLDSEISDTFWDESDSSLSDNSDLFKTIEYDENDDDDDDGQNSNFKGFFKK